MGTEHQRKVMAMSRRGARPGAFRLILSLGMLVTPFWALAESDASTQVPTTQVEVCQGGSPEFRFGTREQPGQLAIDLGEQLPGGAKVEGFSLTVHFSAMRAVTVEEAGPLWRWHESSEWRPLWGNGAVSCRPDAATGDCPEGQRLVLGHRVNGGPPAAPSWTLELADPTEQVTTLWVQRVCLVVDYWPVGQAPAPVDQGPPLLLPDFGFGQEPDAGPEGPPGEAGIFAPLPEQQPDAKPEGSQASPLPSRTGTEKSGCSSTPGLGGTGVWAMAALAYLRRRRR